VTEETMELWSTVCRAGESEGIKNTYSFKMPPHKFQIANPKLQINFKKQIPISKHILNNSKSD